MKEGRMIHRKSLAVLLFLLCGVAIAGPDRLLAVGGAPPADAGAATERPADFSLLTVDGQRVTLNRFLGEKPVLLVFWATWCPECREAVPRINALHDGALGGKLQILGINYRESREKVASAVKARGIRYPVLLDDGGKVAGGYGILGIPTYILIGRDRTIMYREHVLPADFSPYL
jgi:peroxiredoxin